ncbi:PadR family transcriptional regulator [Tessaracoccus rhinocerotis]|nr:PadR family transcriptional regulator [Tessaracoccus rhinocerotis]
MNERFDMNFEAGREAGRGHGHRGHRRGGRRHAPGFGEGGPGFGPPGMGGPGRGRGPGGPRRRSRGDVRTAVLALLAEEPMHGYQLMQTITERSNGNWSPSPGAIYPTLSQLEDEGLVTVTADGGRKLAALTEAGQAYVAEQSASWTDPFQQGDPDGVNLRELLHGLMEAARSVGRTGNPEQRTQAAEILRDARSKLYLLLADQ